MPNLLLSGASGQLCSAISRRIHAPFSILCGVDPVPPEGCAYPVYPSFSLVPTAPEVIVDASHHTAIRPLLEYATAHHTPVVLCTTGHTAAELSFIQQAAREIPVLQSQNMALGIHLIASLVRQTAAILGDGYDIEIVEAHHRRKTDAPSGSAYLLAAAASAAFPQGKTIVCDRHDRQMPRAANEIGISSIRGGTMVGEHTVLFAGQDEVITITHRADSRDLFATGALRAAAFLIGKPNGFYTMDDVCHIESTT